MNYSACILFEQLIDGKLVTLFAWKAVVSLFFPFFAAFNCMQTNNGYIVKLLGIYNGRSFTFSCVCVAKTNFAAA